MNSGLSVGSETPLLHISETHPGYVADSAMEDSPTSTGDLSTTGAVIHVGEVQFGRDTDIPPAVPVEDAFAEVVETAIRQDVDAIVLTGSLYAPNPDREAVKACQQLLERAVNADVSVVLVPGSESTAPEEIESLRSDGLITLLSVNGTVIGPLSIHGLPPGGDFTRGLPQVTPRDDTTDAVLATMETISPPGPAETADWNYGQIRDLLKPDIRAVVSGSGTWNHVDTEDHVLTHGGTLVPLLDETCFENDNYPGKYAIIEFGDRPKVSVREVSCPPLVQKELTVDDSASYEDVWEEFAPLDVEGAHVRIRIHGADTMIRTRIARELQRQAASVVIYDGDADEIATDDEVTAPGTNRQAVARLDKSSTEAPQVTPDFELDPEKTSKPPAAGMALVENGYASIAAREDDRCGFVFDVQAWENAHNMSSSVDRWSLYNGSWYCPHQSQDGHETCIFHTSDQNTNTTEERAQFFDIITSATEKRDLQFYGASLSSLILPGRELDTIQNYPVDLQHARVGHVRLEDARVHQPLRLDFTHLKKGVLIENTHLNAELSLYGAHVTGDVRIRFSQIGVRPKFSNVYFDGKLEFQQTDLDHGLATSSSHVVGRLKFTNCIVGGHATFYDATFERSVVLNRTNFAMECRFDGAQVSTDISLFETTFDQRFDLRETTTGGKLQVQQSTFGGEFNLSKATSHGVTIEDSSFKNTVRVVQSSFDRFALEHVTIDGTLRFHLTKFGNLHLKGVTCLDHVELVGDSLGAQATPYTIYGTLTVTNAIFHRPVDIRETGIKGECRLEESVFHDSFTLADATLESEFSLTHTTVKGKLTIDGVLDSALRLDQATFEGRVATDGIDTIGGPVTASRSTFTSELNFGGTTFIGRLDLSDATIQGEAIFDDSTCHDPISFENATFGGFASFNNVTFAGPVTFADTVFESDAQFVGLRATGGDTSFSNARFHGILKFTGAFFDGAVSFSDTRVDDRAVFVGITTDGELCFDDAVFADTAGFEHATLDGGLAAADATFNGPVTFEYSNVDDHFDAQGATFKDTATFTELETTTDCPTTFTAAKFTGDVSFTDMTIDGQLDIDQATVTAPLDFSGTTVSGACSFNESTFTDNARFHDTTFAEGATFENATLETPYFIHTQAGNGEIDCTGSTLGDGRLVQPATTTPTLYNFTNAIIGNLHIQAQDSSVDFDSLRFVGTRYDGFQFAEHPGIRSKSASLETYAGTAPTPDAKTLERTYLNAKNGASQVGDSDIAGDFFVQELTHRATVHKEQGRHWDHFKNWVLRSISKYGQSPARVVITSLVTIIGFGFVYYAAQLASAEFPAQPGSPHQGLGGSFLLSSESFTTLVFGGANVTNPAIRFIGAIEGFIGAFTIALFLYALTQSIDR